jgi:hypothetical protein
VICDLDRSTVKPQRAAIHIVEFIVWWAQVGRCFYGRGAIQEDEGLRSFAEDAVDTVGGWREARRILRELNLTTALCGVQEMTNKGASK